MKKNLIVLLMTLFCVGIMQAQTISLSGKVTDGANGEALPGVSVAVVGTTNGTITDIDGIYKLNVENDATIAISFIGYATQQIAVAGRSKIDIVLQPDLISLDEVVAVGYGVVKKKDVTGSVGSVSSEKLLAAPITSLDAGLQGKIAGVSVQQTTGAPGQSMKIRIRGGSSINYSNNPLYVIDGFIGADITTINPNDIATIDILKDASATAVYGSRGANGVVLITTNAPKAGKFKVSLDANYGVSTMVNDYELLSAVEQMELFNEQDVLNGQDPTFSDDFINDYRNGTKKATNWVDLITQQGIKQNYTLNATGGTEKIQYYFSANHMDEEGIIKNSYYKRSSIRSNIKADITEKISMTFNTYGVHTDAQGNGRGQGGKNNPFGYALTTPQLWEARDAEGNLIDPKTYPDFNNTYRVGENQHPEQQIRENQESFTDRLISNLDLNFDLGYNLTLAINTSGSYASNYSGQRTLEDFISISRDDVTATQRYGRNVSWMNTDILTYENDFGRHHLKVSGVYEYSKSINRNLNATVGTLSTLANEWYLLGNGIPTTTASGYNESTMRSWMGRVNYSFSDKYLLTASMRADGTSKFSDDTRWGYFPSMAFAWRASEEPFIQDINWIHNLKVRVGYGATGNTAVGPYAVLSTLNSTPESNASYYAMENGILVSGLRVGELTNPNLKWETTTQTNFGIDLAVLGGKLSATIDLYSKYTSDVIIAKSIPQYTGHASFTDNVAEISNKGIELGINYNILDRGDLKWDANFNFSKNVNKVEDLGGGVDQIFVANEDPLGIWMNISKNKFVVKEGESMGSFWGLKAIGLWGADEATEAAVYKSNPGNVKYEDLNDDGELNAQDHQIIGNAQPDFTYSFGTSVAFKGFDLAVQCIGSQGNEIFNFTKNALSQKDVLLSTDFRNRWSASNPNGTYTSPVIQTDHTMSNVSSQYIEDGSFFKISNVTLGYTLPKTVTDVLKLGSVRAYVSANNLLTITNYSGLDPEGSSTDVESDSQSGIDSFSYPLTRTVMGGIKINF